ncbi:hypothetical protein FDP41_006751 [Naegleria fowleri]|uniref:RING-type domain-containing protein n=1 Tax=Naegleria fowleri TaxID=5763 RepID=A0A6A5BI69_NAEFO|nr:uncharacterized protein FDP41_006751 [Naegleria fowleri]KAF0974141.1 hypothetical protein FDP41_006751 [Naegleria fowleri]
MSIKVIVCFLIVLLPLASLYATSNRNLTLKLHQAIEQHNASEIAKLLREGADFTEYIQYRFLRQNSFDVARYYRYEDEYNQIVKNWLTEIAKNGNPSTSPYSVVIWFVLYGYFMFFCLSVCIAIGCFQSLRTFCCASGRSRSSRNNNNTTRNGQDQDIHNTCSQITSQKVSTTSSSSNNTNGRREEDDLCCICFERRKDTALECGHVFCGQCASKCTSYCFTCRKRHSGRTIKLYY